MAGRSICKLILVLIALQYSGWENSLLKLLLDFNINV